MIKQVVLFLISLSICLGLIFFFNGNIRLTTTPLPPLGKLLDPFSGIWNNAQHQDQFNIEGAQPFEDAKIWVDDRLVPHIFANSIDDALYLQGFMEAKSRLFQMDMIARGASGRAAEVLGPRGIEIDRSALRKGMCLAGDRAVELWSKQEKITHKVDAYLRGVNDYIKGLKPQDYPIEYKLLDFRPSLWTARDLASVYLYMCDVLAGKSTDIQQTNALNVLGEEIYKSLYEAEFPGDKPVILNQGKLGVIVPRSNADSSAFMIPPINVKQLSSAPDGIGSNNWAVTGSKSKTGKPILASDPHLRLNLPSIWYELQISAPGFNAYGVSVPGIVGILIGFNEQVAWAETNGSIDVSDLIKVQWKDKSRKEYMYDGKFVPTKLIETVIKVKGEADLVDITHLTNYGPIKYYSSDAQNDLAVQWVVLDDVPFDVALFADIMQSKDVFDLDKKINGYSAPAQNILTADKKGNIGLRVMGNIPARANLDGLFVEKGIGKSNKWGSYIPFEDMPHEINPTAEFLTSSNQRNIALSYPYYLNGNFETYRNLRIHNIMGASTSFGVKEMKQMQGDNVSVKAQKMVPYIVKYSKGKYELYDEELENWDFGYDAEDHSPVVFDLIFKKLVELTYDELSGNNFEAALPNERMLEVLMEQPTHKIFDIKSTSYVENLEDIVNMAIKEVSTNMAVLPYEKSRNVSIPHLLRIPAFSIENMEIDGNGDCINAQTEDWGPSWRMVVSLDDKIEAWGVYPGGQSGDPASKHYKDLVGQWKSKSYFKLNFLQNDADAKSSGFQLFTIKGKGS